MITILKRWSAWAPGVETPADWHSWGCSPVKLKPEGVPAIPEVPAIRRRRLSSLSRMAFKVAFECLKGELHGGVNSVYASHHGEMQTMLELTDSLICQEPLSPMKFSHSVHNTTEGLISIENSNQSPSVSLCGGKASFCYGFLEALAMAHRNPEKPTLLVMMDLPMPEVFTPFSRPPTYPYAFAVLLVKDSALEGTRLQLELAQDQKVEDVMRHPQALVFLQWLLSEDTRLTLRHHHQCWTWQKL